MKNIFYLFITIALGLFACSDGNEGTSNKESKAGDHVWKEQTDAIEKAKEVEGIIQDDADEQRKLIEEQTH